MVQTSHSTTLLAIVFVFDNFFTQVIGKATHIVDKGVQIVCLDAAHMRLTIRFFMCLQWEKQSSGHCTHWCEQDLQIDLLITSANKPLPLGGLIHLASARVCCHLKISITFHSPRDTNQKLGHVLTHEWSIQCQYVWKFESLTAVSTVPAPSVCLNRDLRGFAIHSPNSSKTVVLILLSCGKGEKGRPRPRLRVAQVW